VAEGAPLLRVYRETYRGFESLPLRHFSARRRFAERAKQFRLEAPLQGRAAPPSHNIEPERWPSGLRRTLGKRVYRKVPWVRIPLSPPPSLPTQRLFGKSARRPGKSRDSAGFWARGFAHPNRRLRVPSPKEAAARVFLCCQFWRFGFAPDSPRSTESSNSTLSAIQSADAEISRLLPATALEIPAHSRVLAAMPQ
jgi:hypothetical protein